MIWKMSHDCQRNIKTRSYIIKISQKYCTETAEETKLKTKKLYASSQSVYVTWMIRKKIKTNLKLLNKTNIKVDRYSYHLDWQP